MFHGFIFADRKIIQDLLILIELRYDDINKNSKIDNVSTRYYKAVKRIVGTCTWNGNHLAQGSILRPLHSTS